jgi:hypothetical protein
MRAASAQALRPPALRSPLRCSTTTACSTSGAAQTAIAPARSITSNVRIDSEISLPSRRPHPESRTPTRFAMRVDLPWRRGKCPGQDRGARPARQVQVMLQVVDAREPVIEELLGPKKVREVTAAVRRAALARAAVLDRVRDRRGTARSRC